MAASCAAPTLIHSVRRSHDNGLSSMPNLRNYRIQVTGAVPLKSCLNNSLQPKSLSFPSSLSGQSTNPRLGKDHCSSFPQTNAIRELVGSVTKAQGFRFAVVVARFNEFITRPLMEKALATFRHYSVQEENIDIVWVPGVFEIGVAAERGDTMHYDAVANSSASGVLSAGLNSVELVYKLEQIAYVIALEELVRSSVHIWRPCENMDQAMNRAGGKVGNKGSEAALTAMEMASLFEHHLSLSSSGSDVWYLVDEVESQNKGNSWPKISGAEF